MTVVMLLLRSALVVLCLATTTTPPVAKNRMMLLYFLCFLATDPLQRRNGSIETVALPFSLSHESGEKGSVCVCVCVCWWTTREQRCHRVRRIHPRGHTFLRVY